MSNRTLLEFNHDYCPNIKEEDDVRKWAEGIIVHLRTGDRPSLPNGVTFKHMRHHSEPDPMSVTTPSLPSARQIAEKWQPNWQGIINETQATAITEEIFELLSSDKVSKEVGK